MIFEASYLEYGKKLAAAAAARRPSMVFTAAADEAELVSSIDDVGILFRPSGCCITMLVFFRVVVSLVDVGIKL